jgi:L-ascorbate metabolism protein UlaG (beta-lactamase superfamily)
VTRILYVGHATVLVEMGGTALLTDPVLRRRVGHLRRLVRAVAVYGSRSSSLASGSASVSGLAPEIDARVLAPGEQLTL